MYLVLSSDGWCMPVSRKPKKEEFQEGMKFFKVKDGATLENLGVWYGRGFASDSKVFKEIK